MSTRGPTPRPRRGPSPVRLYHEHDQDLGGARRGRHIHAFVGTDGQLHERADGSDLPATASAAPLYPHITVQMVGEDGNAIIGRTRRVLERGASGQDIAAFFEEATAGDYDHLLATVLRWVEVG